MEKTDCGKAIVLKNIYYDLDKYFIREDAKPELNKLAQFMKDNPGVKVELSSHTDSRASDSYNMTLSQKRADAAVDYLVIQGIKKERLIPVGYGERKLLNRCKDGVDCSEGEHQINRRTEIKVICPDNR
ncbi:OmpA family protein [Niabella hibiscisoli]|uniref:OmpA family protein n=1 Tax=Niabella hibiscisoli TaxID=1825928 RepID=UPI001F101F94|nr:OmpA family protein [Niabella hibiscisoli]MCH5716027.1 OmpA family protein [Niabella hibiscisoli]